MDKEILKGHLPILVLGLLEDKPLHGYAICQGIKEKGGERLKLGDGTIYPLLYRLEKQGHLRSTWKEQPGKKSRKVYQITTSGRKMIATHRKDWQTLSRLFNDFVGKDWAQT